MLRHQLYYLLLFILVAPFIGLSTSGCWKEYSFEKGDSIQNIPNPTPPAPDPPTNGFSSCSLCKETDTLKLGQWSFKTGNTYLCGSADISGFTGSYKYFSLFGPSACSADTGLVISILMPVPLTEDRFDLDAPKVDLYYYTTFSQTPLFSNRTSNGIAVSLHSYIKSTSIAIGSFKGIVNKSDGEVIQITDGRFKVELR